MKQHRTAIKALPAVALAAGLALVAAPAATADAHLAGPAPIDDVRADAGYRRAAAAVLVRRCLAELAAA